VFKLHEFNPVKLPGRGHAAAATNDLPSPSDDVTSCLPLPTLLAGYAVRSQLPAVDRGADARLLLSPCQKAYVLFMLRSTQRECALFAVRHCLPSAWR
jgi:hypothetical protein